MKLQNIIITGLNVLTKPFHFLKNFPVLYEGKNFHLVNFGLFAALDGVAIMFSLLFFIYLHTGLVTSKLFFVALTAPLTVWTGAKIFFFISLGKKFFQNPVKYLSETGFYVQGGIMGAAIWAILASNYLSINLFVILDGLAWGTFLGQFFGRLGCFNYGCCYGKQCRHYHGVKYTNHKSRVLLLRPDLKNVSIYPSQLYTAILNLFAWLVLTIIAIKFNHVGLMAALFMVFHGALRIALENVRADLHFENKRNLTTFYTSIVTIACGAILLLFGNHVHSSFMASSVYVSPFTLISVFSFLNNSTILISLSLTAIVLFVGYGIHGKEIGTFPKLLSFRKKQINRIPIYSAEWIHSIVDNEVYLNPSYREQHNYTSKNNIAIDINATKKLETSNS